MTEIVKNPLTKEECVKWIEALRSGEYDQTNAKLMKTAEERNLDQPGYCCLGVLGSICGWEPEALNKRDGQDNYLNFKEVINDKVDQVKYWEKLPGTTQMKLADMNDNMKNFQEIADLIEAYILPTLKN